MRKKFFLLVLAAMLFPLFASGAEVDGIFYGFDKTTKTARVVSGMEWNTSSGEYKGVLYSGDVVIPGTVDYEGITYMVTMISTGAFRHCKDLTSITIPWTISRIGIKAFEGCTSLQAVYISSLGRWCNIWFSPFYTDEVLVDPEDDEPSPIDCVSYETNPLYHAHNLYLNGELIKDLVIPEDVAEVGIAAFVGGNFSSVTFREDVRMINPGSFAYCNELKDVYSYSYLVRIQDDDYGVHGAFTDVENKTLHLLEKYKDNYLTKEKFYSENGIDLVMQWADFGRIEYDIVRKHKLTYMVDGEVYETFDVNEDDSITTVPVPEKEGYTFSGWDDLPNTMPGHDVTVTGSYTVNKYKLIYMVDGEVYMTIEVEYGASITPEDEPTRDGYIFSGWSWIPKKMPAEDVTVSGTFKRVGYNVSDNIYIIEGNEATFAMTNVTSGDLTIIPTIVVNNITYNVTAVAGYSCMNNTGITSVTIPDGVAVIGDNAFYGCTGVKSLSLGRDIGYIGNKAFAYIGTSTSARKRAASEPLVIECHAESIPNAQYDSFEGIDMENVILKVDDDLVDAYKNLYPWSQFTNIVGFNESTDIHNIYSDDSDSSVFSIDGRRIDKPQKGMNIIRTSQGTRKVMVK